MCGLSLMEVSSHRYGSRLSDELLREKLLRLARGKRAMDIESCRY
jgi:hypothetical protein